VGFEREKDVFEVPVEVLAKELEVTVNVIKQKMAYWVHLGVVKENKRNMGPFNVGGPLKRALSNNLMQSEVAETPQITYTIVNVYDRVAPPDGNRC
jgi:hypothetical protein